MVVLFGGGGENRSEYKFTNLFQNVEHLFLLLEVLLAINLKDLKELQTSSRGINILGKALLASNVAESKPYLFFYVHPSSLQIFSNYELHRIRCISYNKNAALT